MELKSNPSAKPLRIVCERDSKSIMESADAPHAKMIKLDSHGDMLHLAIQAAERYLADAHEEECAWVLRSGRVIGVYAQGWNAVKNPWKAKLQSKEFVAADGKIHIYFEFHKRTDPDKLVESLRTASKSARVDSNSAQ